MKNFLLTEKKYLITQDEKSQKLAGYFYGEKAKVFRGRELATR